MIDADALREAVKQKGTASELIWCVAEIDRAPTIEAKPVRHGRWEERFDGRYRQRRTYCTACGQHSGIGGNKQEPPYCPHCGVKMDGGASNEG